MHFLVTGHTGFKGAWLSLMLQARGHDVSGISLDPLPGALFESAEMAENFVRDERCDIRDAAATRATVQSIAPDVVIHLAAQPLVRESYREPRLTFETNVMGTLNVLEAVANTPSVRAQVIITTDKVYRNLDRARGYAEDEELGGDDPYSSSKAMADLLTQSWVKSFPGVPTAIARAGNVIGGGDVSKDRLMPDLIAAFARSEPAVLRYPESVRPWQHVLDCLDGYLVLVDALLDGRGLGEWNFGPGAESFVAVSEVASIAAGIWGKGASWQSDGSVHLHEANLLALDASKAEHELGCKNRVLFPESVQWTVEWHQSIKSGRSARDVTVEQIGAYDALRSAELMASPPR